MGTASQASKLMSESYSYRGVLATSLGMHEVNFLVTKGNKVAVHWDITIARQLMLETMAGNRFFGYIRKACHDDMMEVSRGRKVQIGGECDSDLSGMPPILTFINDRGKYIPIVIDGQERLAQRKRKGGIIFFLTPEGDWLCRSTLTSGSNSVKTRAERTYRQIGSNRKASGSRRQSTDSQTPSTTE